jgi:hypothetical protein
MREQYKALRTWGLPAVLYVSAIGIGVGIAFLYNQVSRHIEVVFLFPMLAGLLAGAVIAPVARAGHLSRTRHVLLAGLLAGTLAYAVSFWFDYREFRADLVQVGTSGRTFSTAQVDRVETELLGSSGLSAYLTARAQYGNNALGARVSGAGVPAGDIQWLVWMGEIVLAAGAGGVMAREGAASHRVLLSWNGGRGRRPATLPRASEA